MPDPSTTVTGDTAFISRDLRPDLPSEASPSLTPDTPTPELRRQASEVIGPEMKQQLGLEDPSARLGPGDICTRNAEVIWSSVDNDAVLLDLASGYYFSLNKVGTAIWELLDGKRTLGAVQAAVCDRFDVTPEAAWDDLVVLIRRLCAGNLASVEATR